MENGKPELGLRFETVEIHFIYSFLMDSGGCLFELRERLLKSTSGRQAFENGDRPSKPLQRVGVPSSLRIRKPHSYLGREDDQRFSELYWYQPINKPVLVDNLPPRREESAFAAGDLSSLTISPRTSEEPSGPTSKANPSSTKPPDPDDKGLPSWDYENGGNGQRFEVLTRIFPTGAGTVTVKFTLDEDQGPYDTVDVHRLLHSVNSTDRSDYRYPHLRFEGGNGPLGAFEGRLIDLVEQVCQEIDGYAGKRVGWEGLSGSWTDPKILKIDSERFDYQNPYVFVKGRLADEDFSGDPWWKRDLSANTEAPPVYSAEQVRRYKEAATLLYRYNRGLDLLNREKPALDMISMPRSERTDGELIRNFSWHRDMFVALHSRAALVFSRTPTEERSGGRGELDSTVQDVARFVSESTLDLLEMVRSRWHLSVMLNELLDLDLELLDSDRLGGGLDFLERSFGRKKQYATFLSDPLHYTYEGGLLVELLDHARTRFHLDPLAKVLSEKFEVVSALFEDSEKAQRRRLFLEEAEAAEEFGAGRDGIDVLGGI